MSWMKPLDPDSPMNYSSIKHLRMVLADRRAELDRRAECGRLIEEEASTRAEIAQMRAANDLANRGGTP